MRRDLENAVLFVALLVSAKANSEAFKTLKESAIVKRLLGFLLQLTYAAR
jgi:hypothetical protein